MLINSFYLSQKYNNFVELGFIYLKNVPSFTCFGLEGIANGKMIAQ